MWPISEHMVDSGNFKGDLEQSDMNSLCRTSMAIPGLMAELRHPGILFLNRKTTVSVAMTTSVTDFEWPHARGKNRNYQ